MPKKKSRSTTQAEAGRRAGPEDVEHGQHVQLDEADEAARCLDRDRLHLAHLGWGVSTHISPYLPHISRPREEDRGAQECTKVQREAERGRERQRRAEREAEECRERGRESAEMARGRLVTARG